MPIDSYRKLYMSQTIHSRLIILGSGPAGYSAEGGGGWEVADDGTATRTADTTGGDQRYRLELVEP